MINVHVDVHLVSTDPRLDQILGLLQSIINKENIIMSELDTLTTQVAAAVTVEESAVTLINGFAAKLAAAGTDPAALAVLGTSLDNEGAALAAAVAANTPAAPPVA